MNCEMLDCTLRDGGYVNNWEFDKSVLWVQTQNPGNRQSLQISTR